MRPATCPSRLGPSRSAPAVGVAQRKVQPMPKEIYSRGWTTETKRLLHETRQRAWLRTKGKHNYIDFSDSERAELKRYFDALAENGKKVRLDKLEDMLISLGLAETRQDVANVVAAVDEHQSGELDFDQYLTIVMTHVDSAISQVFKRMMEGKLGDKNLNFQTVISTYRRQLILGAAVAFGDKSKLGARILANFAALQKSRYEERGSGPDFDGGGNVPLGGLEMHWRAACNDHGIVYSRPGSADGVSKRPGKLGKPKSPEEVIRDILHAGSSGEVRSSGRPGRSEARRCKVVFAAPEVQADARMQRSEHAAQEDARP